MKQEQLEQQEEQQSAEDALTLSRRLPFTFAKRNGVVVEGISDIDAKVSYKHGVSVGVVAEIRRFLGVPIRFTEVNDTEFDRRLTLAYESDSSEAMQMVEGLGDELDLASLADSCLLY